MTKVEKIRRFVPSVVVFFHDAFDGRDGLYR